MNKRNIIIVVALAVPVIGLAILSHSGSRHATSFPQPGQVALQAQPKLKVSHYTLPQMREQMKAVLARADAMTPAQFAALKKNDPKLPATLDEMRARIKAHVARLDAMTPEQWDAAEKKRMARYANK